MSEHAFGRPKSKWSAYREHKQVTRGIPTKFQNRVAFRRQSSLRRRQCSSKMTVNSAESLLVKLPKKKPARHAQVRQILQKPRRVSRGSAKKNVVQFRVRRSRLQSNTPRRDLAEISTPRGNGRSGMERRSATKEMSNLRSYAKAQAVFRYQNDPQA